MDRAIVSIVGRPNVGKSTFFNRVIGKKVAIVDDIAGITRDRNYAEAEWRGHHFYLVDTGGLVPDSGDRLEKAIGNQVRAAIAESDLILFLVDGQEGISPLDVEIADLLRRSEKAVMLVVNKVDSRVDELNAPVFSKLGLGEMWPISANQGRDLGDLLDDLVARLPERSAPWEEQEAIKVAIVGRPNVGKSSLVNAIVGQDRVIVDAVPGTTRDSIDTPFHYKAQHYVLIDTAGLRRKARIKGRVEFYTTLRTVRSMERCDVGLLVLDAASTVADQDSRIASQLGEMSKGLILVLNKIDLVPGAQRAVEKAVRENLAFLDYAPLISVSALRGEGIWKLLDEISAVRNQQEKRVLDEEANAVLEDAVGRRPPPSTTRGRAQVFHSALQVGGRGGTFVLVCTEPASVPDSYVRYLRNRFKSAFSFRGIGVKIILRKKGRGR